MRRTDVKLLGLSEVRWMGRGNFRAGDYKMFHSENDSYKAKGVAIICHQEIAAAVMAVSDRIISVRIQGRPVNIIVIQIYAPTTTAEVNNVEDFYSLLRQTVDDTPRGDVLIIMGT